MSTATSTSPVPAACPSCAAPLTGAAQCAACDLPLTGPVAGRLWQVDVELLRLSGERTALLAERHALLGQLRGEQPPPVGRPVPTGPADRREWTPQRVQNLLLVLGGVLLAVAATVFAAVSYDRLGVGGRAAVLLALTGLAATAAPRLRARGLGATAETVAAVALALAALDAWGLRRLGLGDDLHDLTWLASACGALALLAAGYAARTPLRVPRPAAVGLANAAAVLAVVRTESGLTSFAVLLAVVAAVDLALVAACRSVAGELARDVARAATVAVAVVGGGALVTAYAAVALESSDGWPAVAACAALAAAAAGVARPGALRAVAAAGSVALAAVSARAALDGTLEPSTLPVVAAVVAVLAACAAAVLPHDHRPGPLVGALGTAATALLLVAEPVVTALAGPLSWVTDPWSLPAGTAARAAVAPSTTWDGGWAVPAVLVLAAAATAVIGAVARRDEATVAAAALALATLLVVPVALDLPHPAALLAVLATAVGLLGLADRASGRLVVPLVGAAGAAAAVAAGWSLADQGTTLVTVPVVAALAVAAATRRPLAPLEGALAAVAALVVTAEVAALGAAGGLAAEQVGGLLLVPAGLALAASLLPGGRSRRGGLELAAAVTSAVAVGLAGTDPGWLSWALAGSAVLALATALRRDRRVLGAVGGLLLTASSWMRLASAGVDAPEAYALPLAALALLLGHLRFRRDDAVRSQAAYGPGLALLLGPSALAALGEDGLARPLLLGAAGLAVLLLGARVRLQAPLVAGAAALSVIALDLLAPYAAAMPRWTALAAAGTLLVVVGATFEERRREVAALHDRVTGLR